MISVRTMYYPKHISLSILFVCCTTVTVLSTSDLHQQPRLLTPSSHAFHKSLWETFSDGFTLKTRSTVRQTTQNDENNDPYNDIRCATEFNETIDAIGKMVSTGNMDNMWAVKMIDSWGKLPAGIVQGNFYSFGSFDECLAVERPAVDNKPLLQSQYCLAEMYTKTGVEQTQALKNPIMMKGMDARMIAYQAQNINQTLLTIFMGLCVPKSCSPTMIVDLLMPMIEQYDLNLGVSVTEAMCTKPGPRPFKILDIITILILSIIGLVILVCTIYDVIWRYMLIKPRNDFMVAFSAYENGALLFKRNENSSTSMGCINAIRVLSIVWVIYAHSHMITALGPLTNAADLLQWVNNPYSMVLLSAHVSVDSFFMVGGLLVAWTMLNYMDQCNGKINVLWMYFHRYIRLTPSLAAAVLICASLIRHLGDGPLWNIYMNAADGPCINYWWTTLLYVENYVNPDQMCVNHSWYLSVDMQLYVLSPLLIYPLWRWRNKCLPAIPLLVLASMGVTFAILVVNDISIRVTTTYMAGKRMHLAYYPTHCRMGAWLIGVYAGYVLHSYRGRSMIIPKMWLTIGWTASIATFVAVILANYPLQVPSYYDSVIGGAFYETASRVTWAAALAWLVFACTQGYGGPINWFLSLPGWQPLARLSYSMYLVHLPVQLILAAQVKTGTYFSNTQAILSFWGTFGLTLCISLIWTLAFESPIIAIERCCLRPNQKEVHKQTQSSNDDLARDSTAVADQEVGGIVNWGMQNKKEGEVDS